MILSQSDPRFQPELCFAIAVLNMHVGSWLLAGKEVEAVSAGAKNCRTHKPTIPQPRCTRARFGQVSPDGSEGYLRRPHEIVRRIAGMLQEHLHRVGRKRRVVARPDGHSTER
jgi:hypothetical protein